MLLPQPVPADSRHFVLRQVSLIIVACCSSTAISGFFYVDFSFLIIDMTWIEMPTHFLEGVVNAILRALGIVRIHVELVIDTSWAPIAIWVSIDRSTTTHHITA